MPGGRGRRAVRRVPRAGPGSRSTARHRAPQAAERADRAGVRRRVVRPPGARSRSRVDSREIDRRCPGSTSYPRGSRRRGLGLVRRCRRRPPRPRRQVCGPGRPPRRRLVGSHPVARSRPLRRARDASQSTTRRRASAALRRPLSGVLDELAPSAGRTDARDASFGRAVVDRPQRRARRESARAAHLSLVPLDGPSGVAAPARAPRPARHLSAVAGPPAPRSRAAMAQPTGPRFGIIAGMGLPTAPAPSVVAEAAERIVIRPMRTLWLLSIAHAVNHAQAFVLPLIYVQITKDYAVGVETIAFLAAFGSFASGAVQLSYASLTRRFSRRYLLGAGGLLMGGGFVAQAFAATFAFFSIANVLSRIGGSPQHPGRQRPPRRAVPDRAPRLRDQRPHRGRQRWHRRRRPDRRPDHRGGRLARGVDRIRHPGDRHRGRDPRCSSARPERTALQRSPAAASGTRSGGSSGTATCAGST